MNGVETRFPGIAVILMIAALTMLVFVGAAQAQTPAEDQYGSPTGPPVSGEAQGDTGSGTAGSGTAGSGTAGSGTAGSGTATAGDPAGASEGASAGSTEGGSAEQAGGVAGGVLPSTGGAPIYLVLAGTILLGTGATLWLRYRTGS